MGTVETTAISRGKSPDVIPGYRLEKLVGKGGMGEVHQATQLSLGRKVALKLLAPDLAKDQAFVGRFEKEGAALAALSHPNVVSIVDQGKTDFTYYLVMEYVDGPSLREVMRSPLLEPSSALKIILEICRAIDYAHNRGVIHRDLKPENILFDEQAGGIAKVTDFGLAGFAESAQDASKFNLTETHVAMGTASYMAPEQRVDAKSADHRADVYSLGVVLYELVVGEVPLGNFDPPSTRKPGVDRRIDDIVARCLKPLPADRYQKVSDLIAELEPLVPVTLSQLPRKASAVQRAKLALSNAARKVARAVAILLVAAALGVLLGAFLRSRKQELPTSGAELASITGSTWPLTAEGRVDPSGQLERRRVLLGDGPDTLSVVAHGRKPSLVGGAIAFGPVERSASAGRALLDADVDGVGLSLSAEAKTSAPAAGMFSSLRSFFFGPPKEAKSALLLVGEPGRYVALSVGAGDSPPTVEWALGSERRGMMSSAINLGRGPVRLELLFDEKRGELSAFVGAEQDRRLVGDPLDLGPGWKKLFGQMPKGAVGCLEGSCRFEKVRLVVDLPKPPPPPPEPPPEPKPEPKVAVVKAPAKPASKPATPPKRPATAKGANGKKRQR
ncbi:MAG: serine/threonine protein kinase [Myxococcales bacterium]|nr:serine/threonine protein kinase [Myxococcales bacterium]